jgi:glycosyltransferase involved in cell wall biosynthesis
MLTVLMSVYNTPPRMLRRAVESILKQSLSQSLPDFEFLILDDGSTEGSTLACLAEFAAADPRICLHLEPHRGLTTTLNRGLALARGEFIARQDADDWSEPNRLELQAACLAVHPEIGLLGSAAWTHQDDETPLWPVRLPEAHERILEAFWRGNPFVHGAVMFRADLARRLGGYREQLPCAQDYDFFWRMAQSTRAANLIEPLYHYRYSAESVSALRAVEQAHAQAAARVLAQARLRGEPEDIARALESATAGCGRTLDATLRGAALKQADHLMLAGGYGRAARAYWDTARSRPASLMAWAKLARLAVFSLAPPVRRWSFR